MYSSKRIAGIVCGIVAIGAAVLGVAPNVAALHATPPVIISEVMPTGCNEMIQESGEWMCEEGHGVETKEFVVLHNPTDEDVYMREWRVEALFSSGSHIGTLAELHGTIAADGYVLLAFDPGHDYVLEYDFDHDLVESWFTNGRSQGMLQTNGGHVQIKDEHGSVVDRFGWDDNGEVGEVPAGFSAKQFLVPETGASGEQVFFSEYEVSYPNTPDGGDFTEGPAEPAPCERMQISEVLPNPANNDDQYIEIHNPTDEPLPLEGCGIQRDGRAHIHWFTAEDTLAPREYRAWYEADTEIPLAKSVGGTVYALSPFEAEIQQVTYAEMDKGQAWSWFGGTDWRATYAPTANTENVYDSVKPLAPCPEGQERNRETNRCRSTSANESDLKPCRPGQERNPATNRCRSTSANSSSLKPCRPNQERNPETNRCRKIGGDESDLKPCAANQERNPDTNRCRKKVSLASAAPPVDDIPSKQENAMAWWVAGVVLAGVAGYGVWEWRRSIWSFVRRFLPHSTD